MKLLKLKFNLFAILMIALSLFSCKEEVDLIGDYKETVVVHGILDQSENIHYIKINRAYIGPGNALEIAQIPDSSYFSNVVATVTEFVNGSQTRQWTLEDTLVDNKNTNGVFYAPTQKLYKFTTTSGAPLNTSATYKLKVNVDNGKFIVEGQTELVKGISSPISAQNFTYKFSDDPGSYISQGVTASNVGNSHVLDCKLLINIYEYTSAVDSTLKTIEWNLGEAEVVPASNKTFTANGNTFYDLIKANVTSNPSIIKRRFEGITLKMTGGAEELYNYMTVNEPSSSLSQSKPTYTNLSMTVGDGRVVGIFSARQTFTVDHPFYINAGLPYIRAIDKKSIRELCIGPVTGTLLFCSQHVADNTETWYCN